MKPKSFQITMILAAFSTLLSCKKEITNIKAAPNSAITIVNAMSNSAPIIVDFSGVKPVSTFYATAPQIGFGGFQEYSQVSGNLQPFIYSADDTTRYLYNTKLNLKGGGIYSLFLTGLDTKNPDVVFTEDKVPYHSPADSTIGIRFINLSPDSSPVSVNLQGSANGSSVGALAYKSSTSFINFPFSSSVPQYTFEIRDAATGSLLTTYAYTTAPFQNITIAVIGQADPAANVPISAMQENNF